jgi:hypothetical protein
MFKNVFLIFTALSLSALTACTGRLADPVSEKFVLDPAKSCEELHQELRLIEHDIRALANVVDKDSHNQQAGAAALFFPHALLAIDIDNADRIEFNALIMRFNQLVFLSNKRKCAHNFTYIDVPKVKL